MNLTPRRSMFDLDDMFDFWAPLRAGGSEAGAFAPRSDIKENGDHYAITAELPGVDKKDLEVTLENGVLTISAETEQEDKEEKEGRIIRQERRYGRYMRSFRVGEGVEEGDIKASFTDGVLRLEVPKGKEKTARAARRISVG